MAGIPFVEPRAPSQHSALPHPKSASTWDRGGWRGKPRTAGGFGLEEGTCGIFWMRKGMRVFFMNNVLISVCAKSKGVVFNLGLLFMQLCCFILGCYFMALIKILCISFFRVERSSCSWQLLQHHRLLDLKGSTAT